MLARTPPPLSVIMRFTVPAPLAVICTVAVAVYEVLTTVVTAWFNEGFPLLPEVQTNAEVLVLSVVTQAAFVMLVGLVRRLLEPDIMISEYPTGPGS